MMVKGRLWISSLFFLIITVLGIQTAAAQGIDIDRQLAERQEEEVYDDSDADRHGGNLISYYLSPRTGDARPAYIDTLKLNYFHRAYIEGQSVAESFTGTYASPYQSKIYFDRPMNRVGDFYFTLPYSHLIRSNERIQWYDTKVPYTFLSYSTIGLGQDREQSFSGTYTANIGTKWNYGGDVDIDYTAGIYAGTASNNITYRIFTSYEGDRYKANLSIGNTNVVNQESGGITDMRYVTHPDDFSDGRRALLPKDIPTKYQSTWNRVVYGVGRLHHKYSLGFYKDLDEPLKSSALAVDTLALPAPDDGLTLPPDTLGAPQATHGEPLQRVRRGHSSEQSEESDMEGKRKGEQKPRRLFVPVTNLFHDFQMERGRHTFISRDPAWLKEYPEPVIPKPQGATYFPNDRFYATKISNTLGIELLEGFHDWAKMGVAAFVSFDYKNFRQPLIDPEDAKRLDLEEEAIVEKQNTTYVGGRISSDSYKHFSYYVWGQVGLVGAQAGEVDVRGEIATNFSLLKQDVGLKATANLLNVPPSFYLRRFKGSLVEWEQDLNMIQVLRVGGELTLPKTNTRVHANFETLQNPLFVNAEAKPEQKLTNTRVLAVGIDQKLTFKSLNWENSIVWQNSSDHSVTPLPDLAIYSNLYLQGLIAKVMTIQVGVDAKWHTKYNPPYYEPVTQLFRPQTEVELGGDVPLLSVYANMHLKRARFFVMYHNVGALLFRPNHFTMPFYPTYPPTLRLGIAVDLRN
ncbi:MAG: putative porin [Porphyromonas sp.]|nr:putative porin [Porphyromonas sp.]